MPPRASPDGRLLAWQDGPQLAVLDLKTGKSLQLTNQGVIQSWPLYYATIADGLFREKSVTQWLSEPKIGVASEMTKKAGERGRRV